MNTPKVWDRHAINAEIRRRGMTLTGIALKNGMYASACRQGLMGLSRPGAEAIADALGIPFRELFPTTYTRGRHDEGQVTRNGRCNTRAKTQPDLDTVAGPA